MKIPRILLTTALTLGLSSACDAPLDDDALAEAAFDDDGADFRAGYGSGMRFNTNSSGPHAYAHIKIGDPSPDGAELLWMTYYNNQTGNTELVDLESVALDDHGHLEAHTYQGTHLFHGQFSATRWYVEINGYELYELRVEASSNLAVPGDPQPYASYKFEWNNNGEGWLPTCAEQPGDQLNAALFRDLQVNHSTGDVSPSADTLYVGCLTGAVGKAVTWGYNPNAMTTNYGQGAALSYFEATIRMIRADYCGDGSSWTQPGNSVWVADHLGANQFPLFYPQPANEAVWGLHGALCVDTPRDPAYHNTIVGCWHASGWFWSYDAIPSCSPNASSWYNALFFFDEAVSWTKNTF